MDAKVPVIPVALIDSYKAMDGNSLRKVTTQVHYLKPIPYEEYKDMKRQSLLNLLNQEYRKQLTSMQSNYLPEVLFSNIPIII